MLKKDEKELFHKILNRNSYKQGKDQLYYKVARPITPSIPVVTTPKAPLINNRTNRFKPLYNLYENDLTFLKSNLYINVVLLLTLFITIFSLIYFFNPLYRGTISIMYLILITSLLTIIAFTILSFVNFC